MKAKKAEAAAPPPPPRTGSCAEIRDLLKEKAA